MTTRQWRSVPSTHYDRSRGIAFEDVELLREDNPESFLLVEPWVPLLVQHPNNTGYTARTKPSTTWIGRTII